MFNRYGFYNAEATGKKKRRNSEEEDFDKKFMHGFDSDNETVNQNTGYTNHQFDTTKTSKTSTEAIIDDLRSGKRTSNSLTPAEMRAVVDDLRRLPNGGTPEQTEALRSGIDEMKTNVKDSVMRFIRKSDDASSDLRTSQTSANSSNMTENIINDLRSNKRTADSLTAEEKAYVAEELRKPSHGGTLEQREMFQRGVENLKSKAKDDTADFLERSGKILESKGYETSRNLVNAAGVATHIWTNNAVLDMYREELDNAEEDYNRKRYAVKHPNRFPDKTYKELTEELADSERHKIDIERRYANAVEVNRSVPKELRKNNHQCLKPRII